VKNLEAEVKPLWLTTTPTVPVPAGAIATNWELEPKLTEDAAVPPKETAAPFTKLLPDKVTG